VSSTTPSMRRVRAREYMELVGGRSSACIFPIPATFWTRRMRRMRKMMGWGGCCGAAGSQGCRGARPGSGAGEQHAPRTLRCTRCRHAHAHPRAPHDGDDPYGSSRQRPWSSRSTRRAWSPRAPRARACADSRSARTASRTRRTRNGAPHHAPSPRAHAACSSPSSPARTPSTRSPRLHAPPVGGHAVGPYSRIAWSSPGSREGEERRKDAFEPRAPGHGNASC
jgi:hypothetical protein